MADLQGSAFAYVGNWKIDGDNLGITICRLDEASGALTPLKTIAPEICVGALHLDRDRDILYCADERSNNPDIGPGSGGRVFAFRVDPLSGDLTEMSRRSAYASLTSYVTTDRARDYLLATNHARPIQITTAERDADGHFRVVPVADPATTALYRLDADGGIGEVCDIHIHAGLGRNAAAHCVVPSPDGKVFAVCDKGTDEVLLFGINRDAHCLTVAARHVEPVGTSPRYAAFHPRAPYLYVNHEQVPFITLFRYDETGGLERLGEVDMLPSDGSFALGDAEPSDLLFDPSGRFLYSLIRRSNAISVFEVNAETGALQRVQTLRIKGDNPRGAAFTGDGKFLLVALVGSATVASFGVRSDGTLRDRGLRTRCTRPGCLVVRAR